MSSKKHNYIFQAWLVILLALLYGAGLAAVQMGLGERIQENKRQETYRQIPKLVKGADPAQVQEHFVELKGRKHKIYKVLSKQKQHIGWVLPAAGQGFADKIEILIGTDTQLNTILGLFVLSQKETPGLGNFITEAWFRDRFKMQALDQPLTVIKAGLKAGPGQIEALTGATISSEAVSGIVNKAIAQFGSKLREESKGSVSLKQKASGLKIAPKPKQTAAQRRALSKAQAAKRAAIIRQAAEQRALKAKQPTPKSALEPEHVEPPLSKAQAAKRAAIIRRSSELRKRAAQLRALKAKRSASGAVVQQPERPAAPSEAALKAMIEASVQEALKEAVPSAVKAALKELADEKLAARRAAAQERALKRAARRAAKESALKKRTPVKKIEDGLFQSLEIPAKERH